MANSRIRVIADTVQAERIAVETYISYDPLTQAASVLFQGVEYLEVNDVVTSALDGQQSLSTSSDTLAKRVFSAGTDPVTGTDLSTVSGAGVVLIMKAIYDTLHNDLYGNGALNASSSSDESTASADESTAK